jgi:hypothetical protein
MPFSLEYLRSFESKRVRISFDDDCEVIATLVSASQDFDGSLHVVYDRVTWANDPRELATAKDCTCYAEGESLTSISEVGSNA